MPVSWKVVFFFVLVQTAAHAQGSVSGKIVDSTQAPVPFVVVALLHPGDSAIRAGTLTDESGHFVFRNVRTGKYFLKISGGAYEEQFSDVITFDSIHDLTVPDIVLRRSKVFDAVTVTAVKQTVVFRNGNTIVNVGNSALAKGNSVFDLLSKLPGVTVDNNIISLQGKSGVIVMIDNRVQQVSNDQLINLLKSMSAESVERIEILKNPPVKYDASGTSGMISIITKKNTQKGFSGNVYATTSQGFYNNSDAGLSLDYRNDRFSFFSGIDADDGWYRSHEKFYRNFVTGSGVTQMVNENFTRERGSDLNFRIGADWSVSPRTTLGAKIDGGPGAYTSYETGSDQVFDYNSTGFDHLVSGNYIPNVWNTVNYNVNGERLFDTLGTALNFSSDFTDLRETDEGHGWNYFYDANGNNALPPDINQSHNRSATQIFSARLDFAKKRDTASSFEAGLKASAVTTGNDYLFERQDNFTGNFYSDTAFTSNYIYSEQTYAGYANYSRAWKSFSMELGMRAEETALSGHNPHSGFAMADHYFNVFPDISLDFSKSEDHDFQLNLNRRIDRPDFDELNPFIYYRDPFSYFRGNQFLRPQYSDRAELTYSYQGAIVNSVSYERLDKFVLDYTVQNDSTKIFLETEKNVSSATECTYSLFVQEDVFPWWSVTATGNFLLLDFRGDVQGVPFHTRGSSYYANVMNTLIFPHKTNLEVMFMYRG
ncbi:MAG TPA: outer membrane beta-barrel protein, partial [Bacteroidia bacterium]|nr:outer membrane beta-barrel protein [Bacteroidia bacterium]